MSISVVKRKGRTADAIIESKDQRWHCRNRVSLVFGSNDVEDLSTYIYEEDHITFLKIPFHQAKSKAIEEILDNCVDEFLRGNVTEVVVTLQEDNKTLTIEDNGLGIPLEKVQSVYTEFRTGSKFQDEELDEKGLLSRTLGQNGLGASATCLTSDEFIVTVRHYNSGLEQTFSFLDGALKVNKTRPKEFKGHSGVKITFLLAKEVYKDVSISRDLLEKRIRDLTYTNPGLKFTFNGHQFVSQKGMEELALLIKGSSSYHFGEFQKNFETVSTQGKKLKGQIDFSFSLAFDFKSEEREQFISFVNSTPTYDGGFHHEKIKKIFSLKVKEKLEKICKKEKIILNDHDILSGLTFIFSLVMPNPRFESQTKRKLVRDLFLEQALEEFLETSLPKFFKKEESYLEQVVKKAVARQRFQEFKTAVKVSKKLKAQHIEKLLDANERKERHKCSLFICEGDSAIGGLRSSRNKLYQGGISLKGKPLNVSQATVQDVLKNQEFSDIMAATGLVLGQRADESSLRYHSIIFLADSDVDGGHINTLLVNFFYTFWPELFHQRRIKVAKAPLFEVSTEKETLFVESEHELELLKSKKVAIKSISRNKGLGEMSPQAWKYIMSKKDYTVIEVPQTKLAQEILEVCFGKETAPRKELLMEQGHMDI